MATDILNNDVVKTAVGSTRKTVGNLEDIIRKHL